MTRRNLLSQGRTRGGKKRLRERESGLMTMKTLINTFSIEEALVADILNPSSQVSNLMSRKNNQKKKRNKKNRSSSLHSKSSVAESSESHRLNLLRLRSSHLLLIRRRRRSLRRSGSLKRRLRGGARLKRSTPLATKSSRLSTTVRVVRRGITARIATSTTNCST